MLCFGFLIYFLTLRRQDLYTYLIVGFLVVFTGFNVMPRFLVNDATITQSQPDIIVSISGEVKQPGTYELAWGARVEDLVALSGGFKPTAAVALINLALPLDAGDSIFVPAHVSELGDLRISINTASARELEQLPRIGPKMAERIIAERPFNSVNDLLRVKGIGEKTLEQLLALVTL